MVQFVSQPPLRRLLLLFLGLRCFLTCGDEAPAPKEPPRLPPLPFPGMKGFQMIQYLGKGSFGISWLVQDKRPTSLTYNQEVVLKIFYHKIRVRRKGQRIQKLQYLTFENLVRASSTKREKLYMKAQEAADECTLAQKLTEQGLATRHQGAQRVMHCFEHNIRQESIAEAHQSEPRRSEARHGRAASRSPSRQRRTSGPRRTSAAAPYFVLLEHCGRLDLEHFIAARLTAKTLDTEVVFQLYRQLLEGLAFLGSFSPPFIHHDIKPDNIVIKSEGANPTRGSFTLHLIDFGATVQAFEDLLCVESPTTPYIAPPEFYDPCPPDDPSDASSPDVVDSGLDTALDPQVENLVRVPALSQNVRESGDYTNFAVCGVDEHCPRAFDLYSAGHILVWMLTGNFPADWKHCYIAEKDELDYDALARHLDFGGTTAVYPMLDLLRRRTKPGHAKLAEELLKSTNKAMLRELDRSISKSLSGDAEERPPAEEMLRITSSLSDSTYSDPDFLKLLPLIEAVSRKKEDVITKTEVSSKVDGLVTELAKKDEEEKKKEAKRVSTELASSSTTTTTTTTTMTTATTTATTVYAHVDVVVKELVQDAPKVQATYEDERVTLPFRVRAASDPRASLPPRLEGCPEALEALCDSCLARRTFYVCTSERSSLTAPHGLECSKPRIRFGRQTIFRYRCIEQGRKKKVSSRRSSRRSTKGASRGSDTGA